MSYHEYWRLHRLPFGQVNGREDFYEGTSQREAIARLRFLVGNARSVGLLIGGPGSGRSSLLRHVSRNVLWSGAIVDTILVSGRCDSQADWLHQLSTTLCADPTLHSSDAWRRICDTIDAASRQDVYTCLLVDDATNLVAESISSLINRSRHVTAVLACNTETAGGLVHRIGGCPLRIDLPHWALSDSAGFIRQSIADSGGEPELFNDAAIVRLHELSEGRVATLARLAELSLLAGAGSRATQITPEIVEAIQDEMLVAAA
ncbi:hypothetical protein [Rosistilla oblonga]|uniref:AAA+ ATPase domain-containing protein n=1 Tax=Rosistilla oblonga TaxID=2527990 RepID=A0A518IVP8_9BACT|nr:hypothetical protein [Rosistilla oblonga]QDV57155.1 hypothetical protein Mal33_31560 [Rosistilla oblonga]